jgi:hypothetical protein
VRNERRNLVGKRNNERRKEYHNSSEHGTEKKEKDPVRGMAEE